MTDMLEPMAGRADWLARHDDEYTASMIRKAADEIERLRKDKEGLLILLAMTEDAAAGHQERAEMLRTALRNLLADTQHANHNCGDADCPVALARAALTEAGYG